MKGAGPRRGFALAAFAAFITLELAGPVEAAAPASGWPQTRRDAALIGPDLEAELVPIFLAAMPWNPIAMRKMSYSLTPSPGDYRYERFAPVRFGLGVWWVDGKYMASSRRSLHAEPSSGAIHSAAHRAPRSRSRATAGFSSAATTARYWHSRPPRRSAAPHRSATACAWYGAVATSRSIGSQLRKGAQAIAMPTDPRALTVPPDPMLETGAVAAPPNLALYRVLPATRCGTEGP